MVGTVLVVGTRKGLWVGTSEESRREWSWSGPHFSAEEVYSVATVRTADGVRLLAGATSTWVGPRVRSSTDLGAHWEESDDGGLRFPEQSQASVERIWQLTPGVGRDGEDVVWAGTEPGAVWRSADGGRSFALERGLWDHPHRAEWGAGFGGQAFHTILPHPTDPASVTAAISTGGVYQTRDGGRSWEPRNTGIRAEFLPEGAQYPEFGQCVHKVARHPARPERLYLQNHGGVYRSDDEGGQWTYIGEGLSSDFGFPIVVHPREPDTVFVFPISGDGRHPPQARARVWRSRDAGESWEPLGDGLPDGFWVGVLRDAMCADDHETPGLYLGGRDGTVWASPDAGESWSLACRHLPDVLSVRAAHL